MRCTPCEIYEVTWRLDCNGNRLDDLEEIRRGLVSDADENGVPDVCQPPLFLRGDCNADTEIDISDAIFTLASLFLGAGDPPCEDACDSNDDGKLDVSDALSTLAVLFLGEGTMPPPGMDTCGVDPTDDGIDCEDSGYCS